MYTITDLYDLDHTIAADYLRQFTYPWEALKGIKELILQLGPTLNTSEYEQRSEESGSTRLRRSSRPLTSELPASLGRILKFGIVHSFVAQLLLEQTVLSATASS